MDTVKCDITQEQYWQFWKQKRESTVTSPFGLNIGHFRSCLGPEGGEILDIHRKMMILPFRLAYVPLRWATTVQILLEKDPGSPWTDRLRIIELFDSQLNAGLQILIGKRMIANALKRDLIHPSTYGSVPNRTAQDAAMEKQMSLDLMRINKSTGAIFDCDAKGCYDRIIAALLPVTCRRLGVPVNVSIFFARLWSVCKHYVRTRHGTSRDFYMSSSGELLYGIGQGNGAGPAFWLANLIIMFCVLETLCIGMGFSSPWGTLIHESCGLGYVDDVTLGCTADSGQVDNDDIIATVATEEIEVVQRISDMAQKWETMLHTNGGRLELKKCHWVLITWYWVRGVAKMKCVRKAPATLRINQTEEGTEVIISRKSMEDAPRILGCHIAADGNWSAEYGKWRAEAARFAIKVKKARFRRSCGEKVYSSLWIPRLRYISSVVGFTKKQCAQINNQVVLQCLPAAGYNRHFPREVVYGPARFGGMQWESLRLLQVIEKVKFFLCHLRREDKLGKLLQILLECVQLQSGLTESILDTTLPWEMYVENNWLSSLKEGLNEVNGSILTHHKTPTPQRKYDRGLMDIFCRWNLKKKELDAINRCRIYLQVIFVSDVSDLDGTNILHDALEMRPFR